MKRESEIYFYPLKAKAATPLEKKVVREFLGWLWGSAVGILQIQGNWNPNFKPFN